MFDEHLFAKRMFALEITDRSDTYPRKRTASPR
jgi:hypothetical protein